MDKIDLADAVAKRAMQLAKNRLPDAAQGAFAAWASLVHANGIDPKVQAALINTAMLELKGIITEYNRRHAEVAH